MNTLRGRKLGYNRPTAKHQAMLRAQKHFADGLGVSPESKGFKVALTSDNEKYIGPVLDQGEIGDCVSHGMVEAMAAARTIYQWAPLSFSVLYLYARTRKNIMGEPLTEDSGSTLVEAAAALEQFGVCEEKDWPSVSPELRYVIDPDAQTDAAAAQHKLIRVYALSSLEWVKACLTLGFPVVFGMQLYESFESDETMSTGQVVYPRDGEKELGGHCMIIFGHDDNWINEADDIGAVSVRNSWGPNVGRGGNFRIPYSCLFGAEEKPPIADEFVTLHEERK